MREITLTLNKLEEEMLERLAQEDYRDPRRQLKFLLLEAARRRGLLPGAEESSEQVPEVAASSK